MRRLEKPQSSKVGQKPFLENYLDEHPERENTLHEILSVNETQSRAGYMIQTAEFAVHLWKSSCWCDTLVETLIEMCSAPIGSAVLLEISSDYEDGIEIVIDDEQIREWDAKRKFGGRIAYHQGMSSSSPARGGTRKARRNSPPKP